MFMSLLGLVLSFLNHFRSCNLYKYSNRVINDSKENNVKLYLKPFFSDFESLLKEAKSSLQFILWLLRPVIFMNIKGQKHKIPTTHIHSKRLLKYN